MEYENDYELLYLIHAMDETALKLLLEKYEGLACSIVYRFQKKNMRFHHQDDLLQLAKIKLLQAVENYREDQKVPFLSFYNDIVKHALIDNYREKFTFKGFYDNTSVSLDMQVSDVYEQYHVIDFLNVDEIEVTTTVFERIRQVKKELKPLECRIVDLRMQGYTYSQISKDLHINLKKVDNTLKKVRNQKQSIRKRKRKKG